MLIPFCCQRGAEHEMTAFFCGIDRFSYQVMGHPQIVDKALAFTLACSPVVQSIGCIRSGRKLRSNGVFAAWMVTCK